MGTSNFARGNASRIFAFAMRQDKCCVDCGSEDITDDTCNKCGGEALEPDTEMDYNDTRDNVYYELKKLAEEKGFNFYEDNDSEGRQYYTKNICSLGIGKVYNGIDINVEILVSSTTGYYEGASLDWKLGYTLPENWDHLPEEWEIAECLAYYGDNSNNGWAKIQAPKALKWMERKQDELVKLVEKVFEQFTTPLNCVGTFSNGESVYELANKTE